MLSANDVSACSGFLGAWLLVAGPMFQGALELREQDLDREALRRVAQSVPAPPRVSPWWWLVPPVLYVLHRRSTLQVREQMWAAMTPDQRAKMVAYVSKATGWFMVSGGGTLLACQETWQLVTRYVLPSWSFWVLIAVMLLACTLNTATRMARADRMVDPEGKRAAKQAIRAA